MLNAIASVAEETLFVPLMVVFRRRKPPFAAPNAAVLVRAFEAPPLSAILNAEEGMLLPPPSVRAAVASAKYASTVTAVRVGFRIQDVVAVIPVLPGLVVLPAV